MAARRAPLVVCALAALAIGLTLFSSRSGPGVSPDSVTYLSAGTNLAEGAGYVDFTGDELTVFPPGFPGVLASGSVLGIQAETTARVFNAACFGAAVALTFLVLRRHTSRSTVALFGAALVALSPPLLVVSDLVWSEMGFVALTLAFSSRCTRRSRGTPVA